MYSCKKVSELKCEAEVRKLTLLERIGLFVHMLVCAGCRKIEKQMEFIRRASKRLGNRHLSDAHCGHCLSDQAKERISSALSDSQQNEDK